MVPLLVLLTTVVAFLATISTAHNPDSTLATDMKMDPTKKKPSEVPTYGGGRNTDIQFSFHNETGHPPHSGNVGLSAHGYLAPYGDLGAGCGFNWDGVKQFGGGFDGGVKGPDKKPLMGVGGGYNYTGDLLEVGAGISGFQQKVNYKLVIMKDGSITITFDASKPLNCDFAKGASDQQSYVCKSS